MALTLNTLGKEIYISKVNAITTTGTVIFAALGKIFKTVHGNNL